MKKISNQPLTLSIVFLGLLFVATPRVFARIDFVQLTDPHVFEKPNRPGQALRNQNAFTDCIEQINRMNNQMLSNGLSYSFVAVTGDIGIEQRIRANSNEWNNAVAEVAGIITQSEIRTWLFVPGNNDLDNEIPRSISDYHRFISGLKGSLPGYAVIDLCPSGSATNGSISTNYTVKGHHFVGFNNASFKNNNSMATATVYEVEEQDCVQQVFQRLQQLPDGPAYILYHIPEVDDPLKVDKFREGKKHRSGLEFSSWTVSDKIWDAWDKIVKRPGVKGLIAGHFHSNKQECYRNFDWLQNRTYKALQLNKLFISPPIACKFQEDYDVETRGFRTYTIDDHDQMTSDIIWYGFLKDSPQKMTTGPVCKQGMQMLPCANANRVRNIRYSNHTFCEEDKWFWILAVAVGMILFWLVILQVAKARDQSDKKMAARMLSASCAIIALIHFYNSAGKADWVLLATVALGSAPWLGYVFKSITKHGIEFWPVQGQATAPSTSGAEPLPILPPQPPPAATGAVRPSPLTEEEIKRIAEEVAKDQIAARLGRTAREMQVREVLDENSFRPEEKKVLATLWKYQKRQFPSSRTQRWTFGVGPGAPDYAAFSLGVIELTKQGLVELLANGQVMLSNTGLNFCEKFDAGISKWTDTYDRFSN